MISYKCVYFSTSDPIPNYRHNRDGNHNRKDDSRNTAKEKENNDRRDDRNDKPTSSSSMYAPK